MDNKIKINAYCHECGERLEVFVVGATDKTEVRIDVMPCRSCIRKAASQPDVEADCVCGYGYNREACGLDCITECPFRDKT